MVILYPQINVHHKLVPVNTEDTKTVYYGYWCVILRHVYIGLVLSSTCQK